MADPSQSKLAGVTLLVLSAALAALVTLHPAGLKAPAWVAYLTISIVGLAGVLGLARAYGRHLLADGLTCVVLAGLLLTGLWVALCPGPRHCVGRLPSTGAVVSAVSETTCRSAFGLGALMVAGMLVIAVRGWWHRRSAG